MKYPEQLLGSRTQWMPGCGGQRGRGAWRTPAAGWAVTKCSCCTRESAVQVAHSRLAATMKQVRQRARVFSMRARCFREEEDK